MVVHAGWVFDESLIRALSGKPNTALVDDDRRSVALHVPAASAKAAVAAFDADRSPSLTGLTLLNAQELAGNYNSALRKREPPVLERLTPASRDAVEKRLFQGSYKGVTDLVTKYVWPAPARVVTRWCALAKITPNQVTFAGLLLTLLEPLPLIGLGLCLFSVGLFVAQTATTSFVGEAAGPERGPAVGLYVTCYYLGGSAGGVVPALVWHGAGWPGVVALICAGGLLSASLGWRSFRFPKNEPHPVADALPEFRSRLMSPPEQNPLPSAWSMITALTESSSFQPSSASVMA